MLMYIVIPTIIYHITTHMHTFWLPESGMEPEFMEFWNFGLKWMRDVMIINETQIEIIFT